MRLCTLEQVVQPYKKYPKTIQNAILLAHTHPAFLPLTKCTRRVLYALLTRACQHDGCRPIKARIDRLALEAEVSDKSVQRAIATFRKIGWLEQADRRSEFGLFCSRQYQFSPTLCTLVRLPVGQQAGATVPQETEMSDGAIYVDLTFKEDQRQISVRELKGKPVDLPAALQRASDEFSIRPTGIAKLRGIARAAGHELEHIVTVARQYLHRVSATENRAYRYLESMATKPAQLVDYQARASQVERLALVETQAAHVTTLAERCRNKRFVGPAGLVVRVFDTAAEVVQDGVFRTVPFADLPKIYALVEEGTLREAESGMQPAVSAFLDAKPQSLAVMEPQVAHATLAERCRNKRFVGPAGLIVRVFDTAAEVVQDGVYRTVPFADLPRIYALVEEGILREPEPGMQLAASAFNDAKPESPVVVEPRGAHATLAELSRNKRFVGPAGLVVQALDTAAELVEDGVYRTVPIADLPRIYALVEEGTLREAEPGMQPVASAFNDANPQTQHPGVARPWQRTPKPTHGIAPTSNRGAGEKAEPHLAQLRALVGLTKKRIAGENRAYTARPGNVCVA